MVTTTTSHVLVHDIHVLVQRDTSAKYLSNYANAMCHAGRAKNRKSYVINTNFRSRSFININKSEK